MTFRVQPATLDGCAAQMDRAADDATATKNYLGGYQTSGGWNGALIELVGDSHNRSLAAAVAGTEKAAGILHGTREGLTGAARYYRTTDTAAAARMDATIPGRCPGAPTTLESEWGNNPCGPSFLDSREPSGRLKPVDDIENSHPLAVLDNLSVSHWALKGFDFVFGFNPLDKVTQYFLGDWNAVGKAGVAIGNGAEAVHDLAYNVQGGAIALRGGWEGMAADSAYQHLTGLANGVQELVDPMQEIAKQFAHISHGVWSACEATTGFIKGMLDAAIIAGIAAAAGTITAETGVGALLGYGVAALEVCRLLDMWAEATKVMTTVYGLVQTGIGVVESQISRIWGTKMPDLGGYGAYHHPLVTG